ncbi:uncharacterized protein PFB0765w [Nilaparvata lugens]|uniref:uncharacterized protein PFB0765w n=1 Tax=Nilaparvata lugens TaxID=108931 RepID=UPI00193CD685|nr:uncharacterized protein PFB0765w [Nilaparvata lugens]
MDDKQSSADHFSSKLKQYENWKSKDRCKVDCGNSNENKDLGNFSSMHHEATTGFDGSDLLVAEGIAAQQKRSALPSKAKPPKHHEEPPGSCLIPRERIKALEDELKVRDSIISVILKEIGEGETSVDASVGPINSSLQMMDDQQFPSVYSPKLQNVIQLLRRNGWDSVNFNQFQGQSDIPDLNELKFSEMESLLKEKEHTIRELNLELAKRADTIAKLKEDYKKQHSKSCVEIKNLNSKIEKLSNELRKKDLELHETREALTATRSKMEENFRRQFTGISDFLKDQRGNGESSLKLWLDDTIMKYVDSHENEVACYKKQIETLQNYMKEYELSDHEHELELMASRKAHEAHASGYKEHVDSLLNEIDSIKKDHLQQIEKLQNEIERHVEEEETLKKQHSDDNRKHHENVSEFLKTYDDLEKTYFKCKAELDKRNDAIKVINEELAKKNAEVELHLNEIHKYKSIVESFKRETQNSSQHFENDRKQLETKYKAEIDSLHEKADLHKREADHLRSDVNNLLEIAKCPMEELKDIIRDHQFCEHYIREINGKSKSSEMEMEKIKQELIQSKKCHEDDVATYKNQILNLKEELGSMASFEERLFMELSNHIRLRDDFRSLFKPIEMEAIRLDNKSCDFSNFKFSSSGDQNFNVLSDHWSESAESDDASSVSKRKCNIGVQPHSSSNVEKNLLRQALVSELHKEMECRKLELYEKNKQIECFTKANNDLNEHCKSLEAKYEELKDFTEEKIEEIEGLNNSNKELSYRLEQLESENVHLKSKMEAVSDELSNRKAELDNITDLFDFNSDDSGKRTHSFQMKRLFRNVPSSTPNVVAATALAKFDKSKSNSHVKVIDMIVEQISHFHDLEEENEKLKRNVEKMTCDMKEDDYLTQVLKNELLSFQEKTQNLEKRLNLLECEKKNLFKFEKMVEHLSAKNKQLQETQDALQNRIAQLEEENSVLERKCNELKIKFTLDSAHDDDTGCEILENLILDFSKKAEEALSLKEELSVKQESINKLENELDGFRESKINMQMNIDILMSDLLESEEKLTLLKQNRMDIGVEKRMLEQKLVSLQVKYDQLVNESQRQAEMSLEYNSVSNQSSTELSCKKQLLQTRSLCSGDWHDNGNVEFALSSLISLEQEKEFLKQKMRMFEQFLHQFLDSGCDRNELENLKSNLRDMYEQLEVNFSNFSLKSNSLKESNFDQLITKFESLEKQYKDTCTVLNSEKEELQKHVNDLQNELEKMQEEMKLFKMNSEKELFDKDLKIRQAQLGLKALQMDNFAASYGLACKSDSKIDISKQYQKEMEKIHELALSKLKTVYLNQIEENNEKAEQREKDIAEKYQKQIEALQQDLKEKTLHHHEMKTKYLESMLNSPANNDLKTLAEMKTEHNSHIEEIKTLLKEECEREKAVLKCNIEAQLKEEYKTKVKNLEKEYKNNLNTLQWIIGCEESGHNVESRSVVLFNRLLRLVNWEYKKQLENLSEAWNSKYSEYISNVNKKLSEVDIVAPKYTADSDEIDLDVTGKNDLEKALSLKEKLIKSCEEFYTFLLEFHKSSLENVMTNLKDAHNEVTSRVDEMRLELEKGCLIASLNNKIDELEKENEELKCQLKSAIGLLSNDHGTESVNVTNLLKDSSIVGDYMDHTSLIDVEAKVEERLKKQYEEQFVKQRKYFENLVAELGKNYSDGIMIQHSCRLSGCSTNSGSDSNYDLNNVGTNSLTSEDKGFKTDANNSLKIMKQDEKNQLKRHRDDTLASNQTDFPSSHKDNTRNNNNYEDQIATKKQCSESIQFSNSSSKLLQSGDEYLELAPEETVQDVIEEFGSTWKEPDCNLIEPGTDKNDSTQFGFESKLFHLQNEKRELERVIETLSKQNNVNEDRISALEGEINEYRLVTSNSFCRNCREGISTENKPSRVNNYSSSSSQYIEHTEPKILEKYEYLLKSLQQRVDLLAENLSLEAVVKNIVDNVKTSYESDIEVMQFEYDRRAAMENSKSGELIRKFDQCLAKINCQHFFEKEELVKKMNSIVQDYEDKLRENNEHLVRLIDSQKNLEAKHDEEMKFTKLEFENYLVEILSDCISKFALQSSVMDIEGSREEYESELKQRTDDIAKVIQTEYENRLEEERRIMLKEFCELQRNPQVYFIIRSEV